MKQLLAWTGTSEAVLAMAEKVQHGTGGLLADPQRAWSYASQRGHLWVIRVARQRFEDRDAEEADFLGRQPCLTIRSRAWTAIALRSYAEGSH